MGRSGINQPRKDGPPAPPSKTEDGAPKSVPALDVRATRQDISDRRSVIGKRRWRGGARRALTTGKQPSPVPLPLTYPLFSLVVLTRFLALDQENLPEHSAPQAAPPPQTRAASRLSGKFVLAVSAIGFLAVLFAAAQSSVRSEERRVGKECRSR